MRRPPPPQSNPRQRVVEALLAQEDWCSAPDLADLVGSALGLGPEAALALVWQVLATLDDSGLVQCESDLDAQPLKRVQRTPGQAGSGRFPVERPQSDRQMRALRYRLSERGRGALTRPAPTAPP